MSVEPASWPMKCGRAASPRSNASRLYPLPMEPDGARPTISSIMSCLRCRARPGTGHRRHLLFEPDVPGLDDATPELGVLAYHLAELARPARHDLGALGGEALLHVRSGKRFRKLLMELRDD